MKKERFLAYNDAVLAIIVTIMVLSLPQPQEASWHAIWALHSRFFAYAVSFLEISVLWTIHHNAFHLVHHVNHTILWVNALWLFCVTLLPYATEFVGEHIWSPVAESFYGLVFSAFSASFLYLLWILVKHDCVKEEHKELIFDEVRISIDIMIKILGFALIPLFPPAILLSALIDNLIWLIPDKSAKYLKKMVN